MNPMHRLEHSILKGYPLFLLFLLSACVPSAERVGPAPISAPAGLPIHHAALFVAPCTETDREFNDLDRNSTAFRETVCVLREIESSKDPERIRFIARDGLDRAERLLARHPDDGPTRYLHAILLGHLAASSPLQALSLVPRIESEALTATRLAPAFDHGGPHRLLGDLYRRAPEAPVSLGNLERALEHYGRAVELAPENMENRLGLAETLLDDGRTDEACRQLTEPQLNATGAPDPISLMERITIFLQQNCRGGKEGLRTNPGP